MMMRRPVVRVQWADAEDSEGENDAAETSDDERRSYKDAVAAEASAATKWTVEQWLSSCGKGHN